MLLLTPFWHTWICFFQRGIVTDEVFYYVIMKESCNAPNVTLFILVACDLKHYISSEA